MAEIPTTFRAPTPARISHFINRRPAANFWHAFNFAAEIGQPLNVFVTLNFGHTNCSAETMTAQFMTLLDRKFGPWWRRPSRHLKIGPQGAPAYAWVAEAAGGYPGIHWVLHIPQTRRTDFIARLPKWLKNIAGDLHDECAFNVGTVYRAPGLRSYLLKGCDPNYADFCKFDCVPQGVVHGKRSGVSRSLQRTARSRAGYRINRPFSSRSLRQPPSPISLRMTHPPTSQP
jgi:hypothetical protein